MKKHHSQKRTFTLLLSLAFFSLCHGQVKPKTITNGQPKIIKTQGTGLYDNVHCGLLDKAGNLWFGTTGEGVYLCNARMNDSAGQRKSFINFTTKDGLSSNDVACIYEDREGNLWFGTGGGVCRYNASSLMPGSETQPGGQAVFTTLRLPGALEFKNQPLVLPNNSQPSQNMVSSILQDKSGNFWFGTSEGVFRYNGKYFTHTFYNDSMIRSSGFRLGFIQDILEDKAGNIWFASWEREGACCYDPASGRITSLKPNNDDMIHSILEDKNGNIWFGTRNHGACRYNPVTGAFTNFADIEVFSTTCAYDMAEDNAGNIWFGTELGVWCYNPSADSNSGSLTTGSKMRGFTRITTKDGLSHNSVFSITIDKWGNLWFGTRDMGLCSYNPASGRFTDYTENGVKQE